MSDCCISDRCCGRVGNQFCEPTSTPLCFTCIQSGERAASMLVLDYRDLAQHLPQFPSQRLDGQPGHSGEAPIPIRVDVEALQRTIWWVTTTWAEVLSDAQRLTTLSKRTRDGWAVDWACSILAPRIETLAGIGEQELADYPLWEDGAAVRHRSLALVNITGAQAVLDLMWLHNRARSWLGLTRRVKQLPGRCQVKSCAADQLRQEEGSDTVWCDHCGTSMTYDDYERYGNVFLRGAP